MAQIDLPYPPSSNRYWRNYKGVTVVSDEARNYKQVVRLIANVAGLEPVQKPGAVAVSLIIRRPRRARDLDNHLKITFDALQGALYENDGQIVELHVYMGDDKHNPGVTVTCTEVN